MLTQSRTQGATQAWDETHLLKTHALAPVNNLPSTLWQETKSSGPHTDGRCERRGTLVEKHVYRKRKRLGVKMTKIHDINV